MTTWTNDDGLLVRFGTDQALIAQGGAPRQSGSFKEIVLNLDFSTFAAFGTDKIVGELATIAIPIGAIIVEATLDVTTAFTSAGAPTLDIGLLDETAVAIDINGIDAAIALTAIDAVGERVNCDGALVNGAALTTTGYVSTTVLVANYTAGEGRLTVKYFVPE